MMISPDAYYNEYLKGKNKEQIMTAIRGLKLSELIILDHLFNI